MPQPSLSTYHPSLGERLQSGFANLLGKVGVDPRYANHVSQRALGFLNDLTPVGNATMAADAGTAIRNGHPLQGLGMGALAILPGAAGKMGGKVARKAGGMFAGRVYHGSPQRNLERVLAKPEARQFDNATSQFGAFFAPSEQGAQRYAGGGGQLYPVDLRLQKPYEMPWDEFARFQAIEKAPDGSRVAPEMWSARADELKAEALKLRDELAALGHDGVIVRGPRGDIKEIASFNDVPLK